MAGPDERTKVMAQVALASSPEVHDRGPEGRVPIARRVIVHALVVCVAGCSPMPSRNPESGEIEYRYRPPSTVKENDRKECVAKAEGAAANTNTSISSTEETTANYVGVLFGAIGAIANIGYAIGKVRAEREATYEKTMRACLTEKGYALP